MDSRPTICSWWAFKEGERAGAGTALLNGLSEGFLIAPFVHKLLFEGNHIEVTNRIRHGHVGCEPRLCLELDRLAQG